VTSNPSEQTSTFGAAAEYLTFFIAGEEYAVSLTHVREVIPYETVTRVPGMPDAIRGVTNLRGSVVPVIDLAIKFRLPEIPVSARTCIVLVEASIDGNRVLMGLMTEEVGQVLALGQGELLAPPSFGAPVRTDFLVGMAQVGKKFALVLDIERVLSPKELLTNEVVQALEAEPEVETTSVEVDDEAWDGPAARPEESSGQAAEEGA
jgi:purine-binding chemotaxis protein CheW